MDRQAKIAGSEAGFTLVEVLVAIVVLLVGMFAVLGMLSGTLQRTSANNARTAANNLARELTEGARAMEYTELRPDFISTRLQARGLGTGSPWKIERRNVVYTVTTATCAYDDPADKLASTIASDACTPRPTGDTGDRNGDDFRRVTFTLSWRDDGEDRTQSQTALIVNPSGGLGPRITSFNPAAVTIESPTQSSVDVTWNTTLAKTFHWEMSDGVSVGDINSGIDGATSFVASWAIGLAGATTQLSPSGPPEILDGTYVMTGQPFDERGIGGETKRADIVLNRRMPYAPPTLRGGHNTRLGDWVDMEFDNNLEDDILGYRVLNTGPDTIAGNGNDLPVCPSTTSGFLEKEATTCTDFNPPTGATTYYVVAVDRYPSTAGANAGQLRTGNPRTLGVAAPSSRPDPVTGLAVSTANGVARLTWDAPSSGASFYRIYRGAGTGFDQRYEATSSTSFVDLNSGTSSHDYYVTAVDATYNESEPVGPVTWSPVP